MSETIKTYKISDEDGETQIVKYISRSCFCAHNCNADELQIFEEDNTYPYQLTIEGLEIKWLIKDLLDGNLKIEAQ